MGILSSGEISAFQDTIYTYYKNCGRPFPWRETRDPYAILVSEIMLQQTQTERVLPKYTDFLDRFPTIKDLAGSNLPDVLELWRGLGYNRRALALRDTAQRIVSERNGTVPAAPEVLITYPGIGPATSRSIPVFAFNRPEVFIETNIRRVFLHRFFPEAAGVPDGKIFPLIEETLDYSGPRIWYYGLMDYGVMLKKKYPNPNRRSAHYSVQKPFSGSNRQIRGAILRLLGDRRPLDREELYAALDFERDRIDAAASGMAAEGLLAFGTDGSVNLGE